MLKISRKNVNSLDALVRRLDQKLCFLTQKFAALPNYHWRAWRSAEGLIFDSVGIAYRDAQFEVVIPWWNVNDKEPIHETEQGNLVIKFNDLTPGRGYIIRKAHHYTKDLIEENPFDIEGDSLSIYRKIDLTFSEIEKSIKIRLSLMSQSLLRDKDSQLQLTKEAINYQERTCRIKSDASRKYPSFCPITGDESDCIALVSVRDSEEKLLWSLSSRGKKYLERKQAWRIFALLLSFLITSTYGAYTLFVLYPQSESYLEVLKHFLLIQPVFLAPFILDYMTRDPIVFYKDNEESSDVNVLIQSEDYWAAFLELNT